MSRKTRIFVADFETTVYEGQTETEVWAAASVEIGSEDVIIHNSIEQQFKYFSSLKSNLIVYYHNLKFDGEFWIWHLLSSKKYRPALQHYADGTCAWKAEKDMVAGEYKYSISAMGQWYNIIIKTNRYFIEIRDSLKLLPFSVQVIGDSFKTKHKKLTMEYEGRRYAGCHITDEEKRYIANDVLVVKEALEIMFEEGHSKLTIGSCCLSEYKKIVKHSTKLEMEYNEMFPRQDTIQIDSAKFGDENVDSYVRKSYHGGWCYVVKGKENKVFGKGCTADVNSLYPSMMHSDSGNIYPVGFPTFWSGNFIPDEVINNNRYFFIRIRTQFYLKKNKLPFIQIKKSLKYKGTECLESSDIVLTDGTHIPNRVELTLTMTDFQLMREHYNLYDCEIVSGCWYYTQIGIFDEYIDKYAKIKLESKGAKRQLAKLFLNNLYGKMAASTDSSYKVADLNEEEAVKFELVHEEDKDPGYIPVGSAITSYARNFTIRAAQKNYYGPDKPGFIYADTDSIHCDLQSEQLIGVPVDPVAFNHWKVETNWDTAIFARQKTYIEHVTHEDQIQIDEPYYNIKCAGMPKRCKDLFELSMSGKAVYSEDMKPEVKEFLFDENKKPIVRTIKDFRVGLKVPNKLRPKHIKGGVLLVNTTYEMRY